MAKTHFSKKQREREIESDATEQLAALNEEIGNLRRELLQLDALLRTTGNYHIELDKPAGEDYAEWNAMSAMTELAQELSGRIVERVHLVESTALSAIQQARKELVTREVIA